RRRRPVCVFDDQGRGADDDNVDRHRLCEARHPLQLHLPRPRRHAVRRRLPPRALSRTRSGDAAYTRAVSADRPQVQAGGSRRAGAVLVLGRSGLRDRSGVSDRRRSSCRMKLIRFGSENRERPGVLLDDGRRIDASAFARDYDEQFFESGGLDGLRAWIGAQGRSAPGIGGDGRLGPPLAPASQIGRIGLNFRDHAAESGMDIPREPVIFFKATTSLCGPNDAVMIPRGGCKLDWEVELAIVIGRTARYVAREQAAGFIAGYALHNDYSERFFQLERGGEWVKGKRADSFARIGPFLLTCDDMPDARNLSMWLTVNGATRQHSSTANMIFDVPTLVSYVSGFMTLLPGDVISTGTPAGVALG